MRVIAVFVPNFVVVAHRRRDADLRRRPLALVAGGRAAVVACSPDAAREGITAGMSRAAAEAACAEAAVVPLDAAYCRSEHGRVRETLLAIAPEVEDEALGCWCFQTDGLERLHGPEPRLVATTSSRVRETGYAARVVAAHGRVPAVAAARYGRNATACVPEGEEARLLAPFPVEAAPLDETARRRLRMLGVRTLGDLARLPEDGVAARFGEAGAHAHRLARGLDPAPLASRAAPPVAETTEALDAPAESLDEILFRVRALAERLLDDLAARGLACWEVLLVMTLEGASDAEVALRMTRPTLSPRALWTLLRLRLERVELAAPVRALRLAAVDAPPARAGQLELFRARRDTEQLEAAVERLRARFGPEGAVSPLYVEVHRPEARVAWRRFEIADPPPDGGRIDLPEGRVLRIVDPPAPLRLEEETGRVVCFTGTGLRCQVARISQPYRLSGEWWTENEYARDYYVVLASDGRLLWVFRTLERGEWFVHGEFD
jgi:protein ImuB